MLPQETSVADAVCRYDSFCENGVQKCPQAFLNPEIKIFFPLNMPKATRRAFPIVFCLPNIKKPVGRAVHRCLSAGFLLSGGGVVKGKIKIFCAVIRQASGGKTAGISTICFKFASPKMCQIHVKMVTVPVSSLIFDEKSLLFSSTCV